MFSQISIHLTIFDLTPWVIYFREVNSHEQCIIKCKLAIVSVSWCDNKQSQIIGLNQVHYKWIVALFY